MILVSGDGNCMPGSGKTGRLFRFQEMIRQVWGKLWFEWNRRDGALRGWMQIGQTSPKKTAPAPVIRNEEGIRRFHVKFTGKDKWVVLAALLMAGLCIWIFLGDGSGSRRESPAPTAQTETEAPLTLEALLGEDYVEFLTDTITTQMENRMKAHPDVSYYPIVDHAPLGNYVTIDETTRFTLDETGCLVILFPAGTVTDPSHGEQRFRVSGTAPSGEDAVPSDLEADWKLLLVNPWNKIPDDFTVNLTHFGNGQAVDERIYPDLQAMLEDARAEGLSPIVRSSYRTTEMQEDLYANKISRLRKQGYPREEAETEAAKWVAVPGTSEHQLGLAVDIVAESYQALVRQQEDTAEQKWLIENAHRYGFVLRYPEEKSQITGIGYEPWHYRYVGREAAKQMYESGLCLEEYLAEGDSQ